MAGPCRDHDSLFKGFNDIAAGEVGRRKGETLVIADLRSWFDDFSEKVVVALEARKEANV